MFTDLEPFLNDVNLSFTISKKGDTIAVTIVPKGKGDAKINNTPLVMSGTAAELDSAFAGTVTDALTKAIPFLNNAASFVKAAEASATTAKKESDKSTGSANLTDGKSTTGKSTTKTVTLSKEQKAAETKVNKLIVDAGKTKDPDMVSFLKKQAVDEYTKAKFDKEAIEAMSKKFDNVKPPASEPDLFSGDKVKSEIEPELTPNPPEAHAEEEDNSGREEEHSNEESDPDVVKSDDDDDIF